MNDYKELLGRLHNDFQKIYNCCFNCLQLTPGAVICEVGKGNIAMMLWELSDAADAIEQLVKEQDKLQNDLWEANDCLEYANDILKKVETERDAAVAIIEEFSEMDYCHNFQLSDDWVVDFIHKITKIQKKAKEWRGVQNADS